MATTTTGSGGSTPAPVKVAAPVAAAGPPGSDPNWPKWLSTKSWEAYLLTRLGWPITHATVAAVDAWTLSEDSSGGLNGGTNPLAISGLYPGAVLCLTQCGTSSPVMGYSSIEAGLNATADFILGIQPNGSRSGAQAADYAPIVAAFKAGTYQAQLTEAKDVIAGKAVGDTSVLAGIFDAINNSGWCKGCQGGKYPEVLVSLLNGGGFSAAQIAALGHAAQTAGAAIDSFSASAQGAVTPTSITPSPSELEKLLGFSINLGAVGTFALGAAVFVVGLVIFISNTTTGRQAEGVAAAAAVA